MEKADILELTCRHFRNLQRQNKFFIKSEQSYADRFRDGFSQCAKEVTKFLYSQQNRAGEHIIVHLNECMRRLDSLTNAAAAAVNNNNNNNNMQIANNNNYIPNDAMQLDANHHHHPQHNPSSFVLPTTTPPHHQNIRQPIPIPLVRKSSPIPPQNYLPLPSQQPRYIENGSPIMRSISRDSMSSTSSASSSPGQQNCIKDEGPVWRPW